MPQTPTPSQRKALSLERHLAVVANAGSGKTQVLVSKYLHILECNPTISPRNIAAITFTENAAAELRDRISKEIDERLDRASGDERRRLRQIRDGFQSAMITTIHGFASRVLRAYPVEAGIDAAYGIVHGAERDILRDDSIARVFYSLLDEAYSRQVESVLLYAFRALGRHDMAKAVRALLDNRLRAERLWSSIYQASDDEVISNWYAAVKSELEWVESDETLRALVQLNGFFKTGKMGQQAEQAVSDFALRNRSKRLESFPAVVSSLFTNKSTLKKKILDDLDPDILADVERLGARLKDSAMFLETITAGEETFVESHREYLRLARAVFEVYRAVLADYEQVKADYAQLDFDDLLLLLEKLLRDSRIREELAKQYPFVLIDEYQDTDETQFEIARLISLNFAPTTRLMIVGDPKQSIYRFRNADVEVFSDTCDAIAAQTLGPAAEQESRALGLNLKEERGLIELRESFRMAKAPLAFINTLFGAAMRDEGIPYLDLVCAYPGANEGSVTLMIEDEAETEEDTECEYIAGKIREFVGRTEIETKEGPAIASFSDVAILLRTRKRLPELEHALRKARIPFVVAKGTGFYAQQEVLDVMSYLQFLVSPSDDISLAGLLRSPFCAVSDQELFQIAHAARLAGSNTAPFWQQVLDFPEVRRSEALKRAIAQIESLLPLVGRTTSALLVERIYAVSGIVAVLGAIDNGTQKVRNVEKLLDMARENDRSGFSTIYDFVERLTYLENRNEAEAQADISGAEDAVRIMTVHAAKGLEYPLVFVPFLSADTRKDHDPYLDKELGLRLPMRSEDQPAVGTLMDTRSNRAEEAEALRLLYVALTRAREHLVLTATTGRRNSSWLTQMMVAMPELSEPTEFSIITQIEKYVPETAETIREGFTLLIRRDPSEIKPEGSVEITAPVLPDVLKFYLENIPIVNPVGSYSATQFLTLRECPTKYYLRYVLGLPEEPRLEADLNPQESSERIRGPLLGQFVHQILEQLPRYETANGLDHDAFDGVARTVATDLRLRDEKEVDELIRAAHGHVFNFVTSNLANYVASSPFARAEFELELVLSTGDRIFGILDRVLTLPDGRFAVIDYKTDQLNPSNQAAKLTRYRFQLLVYAYLLSRYSGTDSIVGSLFFTMPDKATRAPQHFSYDFSTADFADLEAQLVEHLATIRGMDKLTDLRSLERNEAHCTECRYFSVDSGKCIAESAERASVHQKPIAIPAM